MEVAPVLHDAALSGVLDRLVRMHQPLAVYPFGSRARGDARPDRDYGLLVVVSDDTPAERLNLVTAFDAARDAHVPADVFPCRRSVFEARKDEVGTLSYSAWTEGVRVYGG